MSFGKVFHESKVGIRNYYEKTSISEYDKLIGAMKNEENKWSDFFSDHGTLSKNFMKSDLSSFGLP